MDGREPDRVRALSLNLQRRHLTEDERAAVVQKARARMDAEAKERQVALAGTRPNKAASDLVANPPQGRKRAPTTRQRLADMADASEHKMRQTERVHKADPALLDRVHAGEVPLRDAVQVVQGRETQNKLDGAIERYPFLRDVPGHPPARLLEIAATLDAADDGDRAAMEDQARRWCEAQRELMPQWKAENEVTRMVDGIISRLAHVNATLGQHGAAEFAELLMGRVVPDNDIAVIRSTLAHLSDLDREISGRDRIRRVK